MSGGRTMGEAPILPPGCATAGSRLPLALRLLVASALLALPLIAGAQPAGGLFVSDSKRFGPSKMDIVVREIERRDRSSVIELEVRQIGSSVGSSMFIACSMRDLARLRGTRHIAKVESYQGDKRMLIGFLRDEKEPPEHADRAFATLKERTMVVEVEQFSPICDMMKEPRPDAR